MDKKNTIILTVLGVAALLIVVVGAAFAYFTSSINTASNTNTKFQSTIESIAAISLTNPTTKLNIKLETTDMAEDNLGVYWATNSTTANYDIVETQRQIAVATVGEGGSTSAKYQCTLNVNVKVEGTMASELEAEDAYIQFGGILTSKIDLSTIVANSGVYPVTFNLNGNSTMTQAVTAAVAIENRNAVQTDLAGKALSVTFSNTDFSCKLVN